MNPVRIKKGKSKLKTKLMKKKGCKSTLRYAICKGSGCDMHDRLISILSKQKGGMEDV